MVLRTRPRHSRAAHARTGVIHTVYIKPLTPVTPTVRPTSASALVLEFMAAVACRTELSFTIHHLLSSNKVSAQ